MKNKWLSIMVGLTLLSGCIKEDNENMVSTYKIDISKLNQQRIVSKNMIDFKDDQQGKHDLLMLMINSVDYYNLVSGKMSVTSTYLNNQTQIKYEFQINIPEYRSYIYQISSSGYSEQIMFRDSKKMYFFIGEKEDLENFSFEELINKKQISIEEVSKEDNLFKFANWSLKDRKDDMNVSRVANDLYGDIAPYLFPEDIALRQLGIDLDGFSIKGKEKFLDREVFLVEGKVNNDLYTEGGTISLLIDQQTGIVLKYIRSSTNSQVEMKMENILIDSDNEDDLYEKYIN